MSQDHQHPTAEFGFTEVRADLRLRTMTVQHPDPRGIVLFLHGFPETSYVWKGIAETLGQEFEVHAFDWPGYGLSTRPSADHFSYAPRDYALLLKDYIRRAGIDSSKLVIYATDIGALPALLLAMDEPQIAKSIVVGDFAPFNRPQHMWAPLQSLKSLPGAEGTRAYMNKTRDEILANTYRRGLDEDVQFDLSMELHEDLSEGWEREGMTVVDAFFHYYLQFDRDEEYLESHLDQLQTPVKVIWGEKDLYIDKAMGVEFAQKLGVQLEVLPGIGHFPHLQDPGGTVAEVRAQFQN